MIEQFDLSRDKASIAELDRMKTAKKKNYQCVSIYCFSEPYMAERIGDRGERRNQRQDKFLLNMY